MRLLGPYGRSQWFQNVVWMLCRRPYACHVRILNVERIGARIDRHESQSMSIPFHSLRLLLTTLDLAHTTRCRPGRAKPSGLVLWDSSSVELGRPASSLPQMGCSSSLPDRNARRLDGLNSENSMATDSKNIRVKLVLLGDSGVGKSCIVLRFVRGQFDPTSKVTVGASFLSQTLALEDSTIVKFEIWDTAGQERYASLAPLYYRGAAVAVVVYDITSQETFKKAQYWVKELQKHASPGIIMALVGNKADLHEKRAVSSQDAMEYAEKNGMFFIETSAKTANNINQLFQEIAKRLPRTSS